MIKKILPFLLVCGLAFFLFSCNKSPSGGPEDNRSQVQEEEKDAAFTSQEQILGRLGFEIPREAIEAPDFSLPMVSSSSAEAIETKLSDYKGKVVFLNFWATWCPPCKKEMPSMEELWKDFKEKDFVILAVNLKEDKTTVSSFLGEFGYTFPVLLDSTGDIGGTYSVQGIPTTYLIDKNGFLLGRLVGTREWDTKDVRSVFSALVEGP